MTTWNEHFWPFSLVFLFWIPIFYINDLYNLHLAVNNQRFFSNSFRSILIADLLSGLFFYLNPSIGIAPKTNLLIFLIISFVMFLLWRRVFNWALGSYLPKINIAFIGYNNQVRELVEQLKAKPHLGYHVSLIASQHTSESINNIPLVSSISKLQEALEEKKINTIVLCSSLHNAQELRSVLFSCLHLKIDFKNFSNFYEQISGRVPIEAITESWFLENLNEGNKNIYDIIKRSYDLVLAFFILIFSAPFWPLIGLVLKIENKEPIFFKQVRAGKHGRKFLILKFRTQKTINPDNPAPAEADDARTTKVGNFMRKTRIDEIPQVLNIIMGDMSFIGPRPERPELIEKLEKEVPFYNERLLAKPGLTGWDQVSGEYHSSSTEDTLKKLQYDLFYIKNRSVYLDLTIILKTIATVFSRAGV